MNQRVLNKNFTGVYFLALPKHKAFKIGLTNDLCKTVEGFLCSEDLDLKQSYLVESEHPEKLLENCKNLFKQYQVRNKNTWYQISELHRCVSFIELFQIQANRNISELVNSEDSEKKGPPYINDNVSAAGVMISIIQKHPPLKINERHGFFCLFYPPEKKHVAELLHKTSFLRSQNGTIGFSPALREKARNHLLVLDTRPSASKCIKPAMIKMTTFLTQFNKSN